MTLEEAVWVDLQRMSGVPCFRGSHLPVQHSIGVSLDKFIKDFRIDRELPRLCSEPLAHNYATARSLHLCRLGLPQHTRCSCQTDSQRRHS